MSLMEQVASELRSALGIPGVGAFAASGQYRQATRRDPPPAALVRDGWFVTRSGPRWIGLVREPERDPLSGRAVRGVLLAESVLEYARSDRRAAAQGSRSFVAMAAAGHYAEDPALVLAIACREAQHLVFSRSLTEHDSFGAGGADNLWYARDRIQLPDDVRRRLRPARRRSNELRRLVEPAMVQGRDQMVVYAALTLRAADLLDVQIRNVFQVDPLEVQTRLLSASRHARRAWTQLSFGRGGGGGLRRALARARELGGSLETIFTDDVMLASDSVKRARVTAGDAALIERFVLPELGLAASPRRTA